MVASRNSKTDLKNDEVQNISYFALYKFASRKDKIFIFFAIICSMIAGCSTPLNALLFARLLHSMVTYGISLELEIPQPDDLMADIKEFAIYNTIVGASVVTLSYLSTMLMSVAAYNQIYRIRQEYLKAALNQDFAYFDTNKTGDFATRMSDDVVKLEDGIGEKLVTLIYLQTGFFSSVIMAFIKGWKLTLVCLISLPVTLTLVGLTGYVASKLSKKEAVATGKAGAVVEEVISSIRTVYAFSGQQKEIDRYRSHLEVAKAINIKKGLFNGLSMGALYFCIFCTYALSLWAGYQFIRNDNYSVETMMAVFLGVLGGSANFGISTTLMEVFGIAKGAGAQIFRLIDNVPSINPLVSHGATPDHIDGDIEFDKVCFNYPSRPDVPILNGVSLTVKKGQSVALVGYSGSGKSTVIQLISRYYDVDSGSVKIDGKDVRNLSVKWLRDQIGLVGQEPVLFNTTVRENIRYGRQSASDDDIERVARQANAHNFIMKLPKGYDTVVGERGASLSGGQKQRVAIARALVRRPKLLLLDEATSALDTASEAKVQDALDKAQKGRTTIIVAHRLSTIRNVDVIYMFSNGQIVEVGSHEELMALKGQYCDMVKLQTLPDLPKEGTAPSLNRVESTKSEKDEDEALIPENTTETQVRLPEVSFWRVIMLNKPEWKIVTFASVCSLISGCGMPLLAVVLGDFIKTMSTSEGLEDAVMDQLKMYVMIFVGIGAVSGILNFTQGYLYAISGECLTERLRRLMFGKLLEQEIAYFDDKDNSTGALCARLSGEAAAVQGATGQRIGTILQSIGTLTFALVLSFVFEWRVGLVALAFVPVMLAILLKQGRMTHAESFGAARTMETSSKIAVEAVANVRTVASLGREDLFVQEYKAVLTPALLQAQRSTHWRGLVFGLSRGLFYFIYAAAMFYGGHLIVNDGVNYADVLKSAQALLMGASSAAQALSFAPNFQKGFNAAGRVIQLLTRQSRIQDPAVPRDNFKGTGEASLSRVSFRYPTRPNIQVLNQLTLDINKGKTIALVGASGCGKSTVIQMLQRYYDPDEGTVAQDGVPLNKLRLADLRKTMGFVQQEPVLFDRTIAENIAYGDNTRTPDMEEIIKAAEEANIHSFVSSLPLGYDTNIGSKGTQLSGGQKQRLAIARALVRRPNILLLDEATSALDTKSEKEVQEALNRAKQNRTCITIAHRLSTIQDADRIYVLHSGTVAESGTHAELMLGQGLYYALNTRGK